MLLTTAGLISTGEATVGGSTPRRDFRVAAVFRNILVPANRLYITLGPGESWGQDSDKGWGSWIPGTKAYSKRRFNLVTMVRGFRDDDS